MNKRHAKTTTTQRPQSIEFTLNTDVVKEISFTCLLYGGTIDWGDEEIEHRWKIHSYLPPSVHFKVIP